MFNFLKKSQPSFIEIVAPLSGELLKLEDVPDPAFQYLGKGIAINPAMGKVVAPVSGQITAVFPTKHAIGITTAEGLELLIHIGVNTVEMNGEGFETAINAGEQVKAGELLATFSLDLIKTKATSTITPVIITNPAKCKHIEFTAGPNAQSGETVIMKVTFA